LLFRPSKYRVLPSAGRATRSGGGAGKEERRVTKKREAAKNVACKEFVSLAF